MGRGNLYPEASVIHEPIDVRFWRKVDKSGDCWIWTGHRNRKGYGYVHMSHTRNKSRLAHRVSWELIHGPITPDQFVLHSCDNPPCIRPEHLRIGTAADNSAEMVSKRRHAHHEHNGAAILTFEQVRAMRAEFVALTERLAKDHGIHRRTVLLALTNRTWREDVLV
jgi:hypothetical protein